jgi:hypothetical protein
MFTALTRKAGNVLGDPALRRWLAGRAIGRYAAPPPFTAHRPPYLNDMPTPLETPAMRDLPFAALTATPPDVPLTLDLPGEAITLQTDATATLFEREYADTEILLAAHRFAWLPLMGEAAPGGWVDALWREWLARFGAPDESWAWHPYTAAERAINILRFARRHGLPGDRDETLAVLSRHGPAILRRLEYFGDSNTGNHLSNNGRGLFLLGLALAQEEIADIGGQILLAEAERIFMPSGLLREGSSHYHLLLARNYAETWLAARARGRRETIELKVVTKRALEAATTLVLPAGMPLIGDISPDCPPEFLACLLPGGDLTQGWAGLLDEDERAALTDLIAGLQPISLDRAATDGWHRLGGSPWSLLAYVAPDGWPPIPGHAHQDMASFELHHGEVAVFVDPGRDAYGSATAYVAAAAQNGLLVDGHDPYPPNKPYYDEAFRHAVGGGPPRVHRTGESLTIAHDGFARLRGVGTATRSIVIEPNRVLINDRVEGSGTRLLTQRLHTTLSVTISGNDALLVNNNGLRLVLRANGPITAVPTTRWTAYGRGTPATALDISQRCALPSAQIMEISTA